MDICSAFNGMTSHAGNDIQGIKPIFMKKKYMFCECFS